MAQADSLQIAFHLHAAADQIGLSINLLAVFETSTLQRILNEIENLRNDIARLDTKIAVK